MSLAWVDKPLENSRTDIHLTVQEVFEVFEIKIFDPRLTCGIEVCDCSDLVFLLNFARIKCYLTLFWVE